jgi:hypothetical protein
MNGRFRTKEFHCGYAFFVKKFVLEVAIGRSKLENLLSVYIYRFKTTSKHLTLGI